MNHFLINVEAIVWRTGRLLVIERGAAEAYGAGWLGFPGGQVDWHAGELDTLERTAAREVREEVGLRIAGPWHYVESHSFAIGSTPVLDVVLLAAAEHGAPTIASPDEVASVAWMTPAELRADPRVQPWTLTSLDRLEPVLARLGWQTTTET